MEAKRRKSENKNNTENENNLNKYFQNIDISSIPVNKTNFFLLENIYKEINQNPQQIILNTESQTNLHSLINQSNTEQLIPFIKNIRDPSFVIKKKMGAEFYEAIFEKFKYTNVKLKTFLKYFTNTFIADTKIYKEILSNNTSTFVLRKFFNLIQISSKRFLNKIFTELIEEIKNKKVFDEVFEEILKEINENSKISAYYFTFLEGLQFFDDEFMQHKLHTLILILKENQFFLSDKQFSFLYQKIVELSDEKNILIFYNLIKKEFEDLCKEKVSNYVMNILCKKYTNTEILYKKLKDQENFSNSNLQISLLENSLKNNKTDISKDIINDLKKIDKNIVNLFVNKNDNTINKKYLNIFLLFFDNEEFKENIKEEFEMKYDPFWFHTEKGAILCEKYIEKFGNNGFFNKTLKQKKFKKNVYSEKLLKLLEKN